jgi:hypothetical protein
MSTAYARLRLPATALGLVALVFTATTPVLAQTAWSSLDQADINRQDQADMLRRLEAQGLVRSMDPVRTRADERHRAPARSRETDRDDAAGVDPRRRLGHERGARTPPAAGAAVPSDAEATTDATPPPARRGHAHKL